MSQAAARPKTMTDSGMVCSEPAYYFGFVLGKTDIVNKPTIGVYDNNSEVQSGEELSPEASYDVTNEGLDGHHPGTPIIADSGIYFYMDENGGTHTATVYYRTQAEVEAKGRSIV